MLEPLERIELTPAEIAEMPVSVRKKVMTAFSPSSKANGNWMLVGAENASAAKAMKRAMDMWCNLIAAQETACQESNIDCLVEIFAERKSRHGKTNHGELEFEMELENARMRAEYLDRTEMLTAEDVRGQSGIYSRKKGEPASRWKREGKIFAVRRGGVDQYPAFQFEKGAPRPVIKRILEKIAADFSPWQIAFWFESGNGWLGGDEPRDCLDRVDKVVLAAERSTQTTIG